MWFRKKKQTIGQKIVVANARDDVSEVQRLLAEGADPNTADTSGYTLLQSAATFNVLEICKVLVEAGADVNKMTYSLREERYVTPLMMAVSTTAGTDALQYLLEVGADVRAVTPTGTTCLMAATSLVRNPAAVKILVDAGADIHAVDEEGGTAYLHACGLNCRESMRILEEAGAGTRPGKSGTEMTPLMLAAGMGHQTTVEELLESGADPNHRSRNGRTARTLAAMSGQYFTVKTLCEVMTLDGPLVDSRGLSDTMLAVKEGHSIVLSDLLGKGRDDANAVCSAGWTALCYAAARGNEDAIDDLMLAGADVNYRDRNGKTPLGIAKAAGHKKVVKELKKRGGKL